VTAAERREYSEKHIRVVKRMESRFVRPTYYALLDHMKLVAGVLRSKGPEAAISTAERLFMNDGLYKPIEELYRLFGLYAARKTTREINKSVKVERKAFGIDEEFLAEILAYLRDRLLSRVVLPISATTIARIREVMEIGEREGWGIDKMAFELENDGLTLKRARLIVRTESAMAMNYGRQIAKKHSRWETETEWIAANDHRTRRAHHEVDGDKVDEGKRFVVPIYKKNKRVGFDMMTGPGDPHASAGNVCNCRCTSATTAKRDKKGRLIQKRNISVILPEDNVRTGPIITI
jgi:hypothetical protein